MTGRRVLVLEDEFLIALEIEDLLADAGYVVDGPHARIDDALAALDPDDLPDAALLDVNLGNGTTSEPVAARLAELGVPYALCTGYRPDDLVARYGDAVPVIHKPVSAEAVARVLAALARTA